MAFIETPDTTEEVLRVAGSSSTHSLATVIQNALRDKGRVRLRAVGAAAVNQAVKACAVARSYEATRRCDLYVQPEFETVEIQGERVSAMSILVLSYELSGSLATS